MSTRATKPLLFLLLLAGAGAAPILAQSARDQLNRAITVERAESLEAAILLYQDVARDFASNHEVAAESLWRLGEAYRRIGQEGRSQEIFQQVVRDYPDQTEMVSRARGRLNAVASPSPDFPMLRPPQNTIILSGGLPRVWQAVSPNGAFLAGVTKGELRLRDLQTGVDRVLANSADDWRPQRAAISTDSKQVAFSVQNGLQNGLRVLSIQGGRDEGRAVQIEDDLRGIAPFGWSPDSREIFCVLDRADHSEIAAVDPDTGSIRTIVTLPSITETHASVSPDGRYIAYDAPLDFPVRREIFVVPTKGGTAVSILEGVDSGANVGVPLTAGSPPLPPAQDIAPVWTPDSLGVVFGSDRFAPRGVWMQIVKDGRSVGTPMRLTRAAADSINGYPIGFSSNGVLFWDDVRQSGVTTLTGKDVLPASQSPQVYLADLDPKTGVARSVGRMSQAVVYQDINPAFSSDGNLIAFKRGRYTSTTSSTRVATDLVVRKIDSGEESTYLNVRCDCKPLWFHDNTGLLEVRSSPYALDRLDLETGGFLDQLALVDFTLHNFRIALSPDDKTVYLARTTPPEIVALDLRTGQRIKTLRLPSGNSISRLLLSPDGRTLMVARGDGQPVTLATLTVDGADYREIFTGWAVSPVWSRDRGIVFGTSDAPARQSATIARTDLFKVVRLDPSGGRPTPMGLDVLGLLGIDIDPGGTRLVFSALGAAVSGGPRR